MLGLIVDEIAIAFGGKGLEPGTRRGIARRECLGEKIVSEIEDMSARHLEQIALQDRF